MQCTRLELAHACGPVAQNKDAAVTGTKIPQSAAHLGQSLAARRQEARHSRALAASPTSSAGPPRRASLRFAITPEDHRLGHLTCPPIALCQHLDERVLATRPLILALCFQSRHLGANLGREFSATNHQ